MKKLRNQKGISLIELIVALGLVSIMISMAFSLQIFGTNVFTKGESRSNAQYDARMAADYITREIRFASSLEILDALPHEFSDDYIYIYKDIIGSSDVIRYKDKNSARNIASFSSVDLSFTAIENKALKYIIDGTHKGESFSIASEVVPLNMKGSGSIINNEGIAVRYKKETSAPAADGLKLEPAPPNGAVNKYYSHRFAAAGGKAPYTYSLVAYRDLPAGLSLSGDTISGMPAVKGSYEFVIKVVDSSTPKLSTTRTFKVEIGEQSLTAKQVAERINSGVIAFPDPRTGDKELRLPEVPFGFETVIADIDPQSSAVALDGTIIPRAEAVSVYITLKVINTIDSSDTAWNTARILKLIPARSLNEPPEARNVTIINQADPGVYTVGSVLTGSYTYRDEENDPQGDSLYKWYRSDMADGKGKIMLAQGITKGTASYTITSAESNKYVFFEVTPAAQQGERTGETRFSEPVFIIANEKPTVTIKITVDGVDAKTARKGQLLSSSYMYFDAEGDELDYISYQWKEYSKQGVLTDIFGATDSSYRVFANDKDSRIYLEVTFGASTGNKETVKVTSAYITVTN